MGKGSRRGFAVLRRPGSLLVGEKFLGFGIDRSVDLAYVPNFHVAVCDVDEATSGLSDLMLQALGPENLDNNMSETTATSYRSGRVQAITLSTLRSLLSHNLYPGPVLPDLLRPSFPVRPKT